MSCALMMGCGEPIAQQEQPADEQGTGEVSQSETGVGEVSAPWKNEHSPFGPVRLVKDPFPDANPSGEEPQKVSFRGKLYFNALQADGRMQLWRSNGTEAGTVMVVEFPPVLRPDGSFESLSLIGVGHLLFFTVADKAHGLGLWATDGTREGTRRVKELTPGPDAPALGLSREVGNLLFFTTAGKTHGRELWVTDGTREGTRRVKELTPESSTPDRFVAVGMRLFIFRTVGAAPSRTELWTSDGTATGTVRVRDFGPGTDDQFRDKIVRGDTLFFFLLVPNGRYELWRTDGSSAGTLRLRTFDPGNRGLAQDSLRVAGGLVYFIANDSTHGNELWRTDGTVAGTQLVMTGPANTFLQFLDVARGYLFFTTRSPDETELLLYRLRVSGSKPGEPKLVRILPPPVDTSDFAPFITASATTGEKLFFSWAFNGPGPGPSGTPEHQLWVTDGTESGTKLLHEPLSVSDEFVLELFAVDQLLLFPGSDAAAKTGTEPWGSDGTAKGTRLLQDINPGFHDSSPHAFTRAGDDVFFIAFREDVGQALWVVPLRRSSHAAPDSPPLE